MTNKNHLNAGVLERLDKTLFPFRRKEFTINEETDVAKNENNFRQRRMAVEKFKN